MRMYKFIPEASIFHQKRYGMGRPTSEMVKQFERVEQIQILNLVLCCMVRKKKFLCLRVLLLHDSPEKRHDGSWLFCYSNFKFQYENICFNIFWNGNTSF